MTGDLVTLELEQGRSEESLQHASVAQDHWCCNKTGVWTAAKGGHSLPCTCCRVQPAWVHPLVSGSALSHAFFPQAGAKERDGADGRQSSDGPARTHPAAASIDMQCFQSLREHAAELDARDWQAYQLIEFAERYGWVAAAPLLGSLNITARDTI